MRIYDTYGDLIRTGEQARGNLFYLDPTITTCLFSRIEDVWLWNKRFCYVNFDNMVKVSRKKNVRGLLNLCKPDNSMCKQCQIGKMTKSSFSSKSHSSNDILELVHTDLCVPMKVESYYGD